MRKLRFFLAFLSATLFWVPDGKAQQSGFVYDYGLSYGNGLLSAYNSLSDAQQGINQLYSSNFPTRDLALYMGMNTPYYGGSQSYFTYMLTNWFTGSPNPNNTNVGFWQIYDTDAGSLGSINMYWVNPSMTLFQLYAQGGPTILGCSNIPPQDCGRLWNGVNSANGGVFLDWNISLLASFATSAVWNPLSGLFESMLRPTSVSGSMSGIFFDPTANLYYKASVGLGQDSWAYKEGLLTDGVLYGASTVVPEPVTMAMLATGLIILSLVSLIRRRRGLGR